MEQPPALVEGGLIALDAESLTVLPRGRLLLRVIASRFDAYPPKQTIPSELLQQAR